MVPEIATKAVRFVKRYPPYHIGEAAGFAPEMAHALVSAGVAVRHTAEAPEEKSEPATPGTGKPGRAAA